MFSDPVIEVEGLGKSYYIYGRPEDRLKQMIVPKLDRLAGRTPRRYYHEFWALRDISFSISRGQTVGIIGRNGSGKSTLLQIICGTLTPTLGSFKTHGRIAALLELGAGFNPEFTGRQNAILNAQILGLTKQDIDARIDEIEAFADVGQFFDQPIKTYSSGMYVRVAFAVQAIVEPEILIVDEALAVGDAPFQAKCMGRINRLKDNGTSILFVSHDIGSVRQLCDHAIWLHQGMVAEQGQTVQVTANYVKFTFSEGNVVTDANGAPSPQNETAPDMPEGLLSGQEVAAESHLGASGNEVGELPRTLDTMQANKAEREQKPVSHWGIDVGCLLSCELQDETGQRIDFVTDQMPIQVAIRFRVPKDARLDGLGVAFSFRMLNGTDIIVSNTYDRKRIRFTKSSGIYDVIFRMNNMLNSGVYMLVGLVEDRSDESPRYYEFLEGAQYFKVQQTETYFGQCITPIEQLHHELSR